MSLSCPSCKALIRIPAALAMQAVQCPKCKTPIPGNDTPPPGRVKVKCRNCFSSLLVKERNIGTQVNCPKCKSKTLAELSAHFPKVRCSECAILFRVPESVLGKRRPCPSCKVEIKLLPTSKKIRVACKHCDKRISVPEKQLGRSVRCPGCSKFFRLESTPTRSQGVKVKPLVRNQPKPKTKPTPPQNKTPTAVQANESELMAPPKSVDGAEVELDRPFDPAAFESIPELDVVAEAGLMGADDNVMMAHVVDDDDRGGVEAPQNPRVVVDQTHAVAMPTSAAASLKDEGTRMRTNKILFWALGAAVLFVACAIVSVILLVGSW